MVHSFERSGIVKDESINYQHEDSKQPTYTLEELLKQCTSDKQHEPIEFGIAGKELL